MRALKRVIILILIAALLAGTAWYFFMYNPSLTAGVLRSWGDGAMKSGNYTSATRWYSWAVRLQPEEQDLSVSLANAYRATGNYTKAEYYLTNAIAAGGSTEVYMDLCRVYVEQDKLLDAVAMLDQVVDPAIRSQLDAQRPEAPTADLEPGFYSQYMTVTLSSGPNTMYTSVTREYPSTATPYTAPIELGLGETTISAVAVNELGLVSPLSVFGYTVAGVVEDVVLEDGALDACVREKLSRSPGSVLTTADLWSITELEIPAEVQDLSQLSLFDELTSLTIRDRSTIDLSFLSGLQKLTRLDLSGCAIDAEQLPFIGVLSQLEEVHLSGCGLSTLSGLEGLANAKYLDLSVNSLSDLSPLMGCTRLETLNLQHNAVSSFKVLGHLTELRELNLANNSLADLSPVSSCRKLEQLNVSTNLLTSLSGIGNLTALQTLDASYNDLTDITGIGSCTALTEVNLSNNILESMDEMVSLVNVVNMDVSYNDILSIPDFPDDAKLASFNGCHNFFEDVSGLADLASLNYVYLDYNNISDISVLAGCYNLIQVNVFRTNVSDVSALKDMDVIISYNPT